MRFYVFGTTCVGKDYLVDYIEMKRHDVGSVRVGKIMRERYPPSHFKGQGAPEHTEAEALQIFEEELQKQTAPNVFILGQPRRITQIEPTIRKYPGLLIVLYADDNILCKRIQNRFKDDADGMALAMARYTNDKVQLYPVLVNLVADPLQGILAYDTTDGDPAKILEDLEVYFD